MENTATIVAPHLYDTTYCCKGLAIACLAKILLMLLLFFVFLLVEGIIGLLP
jgi:hypothetical protein